MKIGTRQTICNVNAYLQSKFWFMVWQSAGRLREGELFIFQRNAHMQY